jgi:hypothetical protein
MFLLASFLVELFFIPDDGGGMFLRNVDWFSLGYTALYPTRNTSVFIIHSLITLSFNAS